jgi:formate hydrogenlyase transcriptional activator
VIKGTRSDSFELETRFPLSQTKTLAPNFRGIVGNSNELLDVLRRAEQVAPVNTTVLILGETGTGKELLAQAVHSLSRRRSQSFVKLNCAALPASLIEAELFGHEKGAFTDASVKRIGRFETANRGTLFLDEIGDLPLAVQPKLLQVLEHGEFERVGASSTTRVDVRLIAATNRDLLSAVRNGRFRADLLYRLNIYPLTMPPLRERRGDIPVLANYFLREFSAKFDKRIGAIPSGVMTALEEHRWRGNLRELRNVIEYMVINARDAALHLPEYFTTKTNSEY